MTDIDYAPRHKRVLRDGQTPRGPKRWARAYGNLLENPKSRAADLLVDRIVTAANFRDFEEMGSAFEHREIVRHIGTGTVYLDERKYSTCSMFCAAMVVQLDIKSTKYADVLNVFEGTYESGWTRDGVRHKSPHQRVVQIIDPIELRSNAHCQHCGNKIS